MHLKRIGAARLQRAATMMRAAYGFAVATGSHRKHQAPPQRDAATDGPHGLRRHAAQGMLMHAVLLALFWLGCALILYAYLFYPLLVQLLARGTRAGAAAAPAAGTPSFSLVIAVHDEAARIVARLTELVPLVRGCGSGEIIVVTDGCRDDTAELARALADPLVRVVELAENCGKSQALTRGCAVARGDILVFADARQRWAEDALVTLLSNFSQPQLGAVSGELVLETASGALAGVGLYWRYEKWLRRAESRLRSTVGVSGSIAAVRRELFQPIPRGIL